jgi:hypothetical protein
MPRALRAARVGGNWETKQSILADMKDSKNNKSNSEANFLSSSVRVYGDNCDRYLQEHL